MLYLRMASICLGVLSNTSISLISIGSKVSYGGGHMLGVAVVVTTGDAVAVADTIGEVVVVVWTITGAEAWTPSFLHLIATMMMTTTMTIITAAPPDPMIGTLNVSRDSKKEGEALEAWISSSTGLRANTVSLKFSFSSFQCCSMICIL